MTSRTHDVAALTTLTVAVAILGMPDVSLATVVGAVVVSQLGSMTPDFDEPTSPLWRSNILAGVVGKMFDVALVGHRQLSHSLIGLIGFGILAQLAVQFLATIFPTFDADILLLAYLSGYITHLVMDSLTTQGVPLLWPIPFKFGLPPIRSWRMKTGGWVEFGVVLPGLVLINLWLLYSNYEAILVYLRRYLHG